MQISPCKKVTIWFFVERGWLSQIFPLWTKASPKYAFKNIPARVDQSSLQPFLLHPLVIDEFSSWILWCDSLTSDSSTAQHLHPVLVWTHSQQYLSHCLLKQNHCPTPRTACPTRSLRRMLLPATAPFTTHQTTEQQRRSDRFTSDRRTHRRPCDASAPTRLKWARWLRTDE